MEPLSSWIQDRKIHSPATNRHCRHGQHDIERSGRCGEAIGNRQQDFQGHIPCRITHVARPDHMKRQLHPRIPLAQLQIVNRPFDCMVWSSLFSVLAGVMVLFEVIAS